MTTAQTVEALVAELDYPMLIVTAAAEGRRAGCLVGFSTQCSIDPLRFLVCISHRNATYRVAKGASHLGVHFLTRDDRSLSELFGEQTGDRIDKFSQCNWAEGPHGVPVVRTGAGHYIAAVLARREVGDHDAFLLEPISAVSYPGRGGQMGFQDVKEMEPGHEA